MENLPQVSRNLQDYKNIQESMLPSVSQKKWKGSPNQKQQQQESSILLQSYRKMPTSRINKMLSTSLSRGINQSTASLSPSQMNSPKMASSNIASSCVSNVSKSSAVSRFTEHSNVESLHGRLEAQLKNNEIYIFLENMKVQVGENKLQIQINIQKCDMMIYSIEKIHKQLGELLIANGSQLKDTQYMKRMGYL